jgi:hypothetical protein
VTASERHRHGDRRDPRAEGPHRALPPREAEAGGRPARISLKLATRDARLVRQAGLTAAITLGDEHGGPHGAPDARDQARLMTAAALLVAGLPACEPRRPRARLADGALNGRQRHVYPPGQLEGRALRGVSVQRRQSRRRRPAPGVPARRMAARRGLPSAPTGPRRPTRPSTASRCPTTAGASPSTARDEPGGGRVHGGRAYVRDLAAGTTTLVAAAAGDDAVNPAISGDGSTVARVPCAPRRAELGVAADLARDVAPDIHAVSVGMIIADQPAISESGRFVAVRGQQAGAGRAGVQATAPPARPRSSAAAWDAGDLGTSASDEAAISAEAAHRVPLGAPRTSPTTTIRTTATATSTARHAGRHDHARLARRRRQRRRGRVPVRLRLGLRVRRRPAVLFASSADGLHRCPATGRTSTCATEAATTAREREGRWHGAAGGEEMACRSPAAGRSPRSPTAPR